MRRSAVFLTTDFFSNTFDRRISQFANLMLDRGWQVLIVCQSKDGASRYTIRNGIQFLIIGDSKVRASQNQTRFPVLANRARNVLSLLLKKAFKFYKYLRIHSHNSLFVHVWRLFDTLFLNRLRDIYLRHNTAGFSYEEVKIPFQDIRNFAGSLSQFFFTGDIDLVVSCDVTSSIPAIRLSYESGARFILDCHEFYSQQQSVNHIKDQLEELESIAFTNADIVFFPTNELALEASRRIKNSEWHFVSVPNALDISRDKASDRNVRTEAFCDNSDIVVLFHGWMGENRNLECLIHGFQLANRDDVVLVFLNTGGSENYESLVKPYMRNIVFLPAVDSEILSSYVKGVDFLIAPYSDNDLNHRFAFPNKLGDAIALRIPIIVNQNLISASKIVREFNIGYSARLNTVTDVRDFFETLNVAPANPLWSQAELSYGWSAAKSKIEQSLESMNLT